MCKRIFVLLTWLAFCLPGIAAAQQYQPEDLIALPAAGQSPVLLDQLGPNFNTPVLIEQYPCEECEIITEQVEEAPSGLPPGVRKGLFQRIFFTGSWLPQLENDSVGFSDLEVGVVLGVPFFRPKTPLLITPRYAARFLERPVSLNLPSQVYDAEVTFRHLRKFGEGPWAMNAAITLGQYSDFETSDADAFRITGQAFAVYEGTPGKQWVFGVVYLNRKDLDIIPAAGLIYEPNPNVRYEAIMPRPRIAWRLDNGLSQLEDQRWLYIGGELGGGVWSVTRPLTQNQDLVTYNDYRILIGYERKIIGGINRRFEAGYAFGREFEFDSGAPDIDLDDSLFLRVGVSY